MEVEVFYEVWNGLSSYSTIVHTINFPKPLFAQNFYDGLTMEDQYLMDIASKDYIGEKTTEEMFKIFELLAMNTQ